MTRDRNTALFAFLAGAAAGALAIAFASSKGAQLRRDLAGLGRRAKDRAGHLAERGSRAWEAFRTDPADPHPASGQDQRGKAAGVWQDTMDRAEPLGTEMRPNPGDIASDLGRS